MEYKRLVVVVLWLNHAYGNDFELDEDSEVEEFNPPYYEFKYGVKDTETGDIKNQWEVREGDNVKGEYSVVEPDGTVRKVQYSADKYNGFNAIVTREGRARHPLKATPQVHEDLHHEPSIYSPKHSFPRVKPKPKPLRGGVDIQASGSSKREKYATPEVPPNHNPTYTRISNYNKLLQMYRKFREENSNTRKHKFDYGINEYFENGFVALNHRKKNSKPNF